MDYFTRNGGGVAAPPGVDFGSHRDTIDSPKPAGRKAKLNARGPNGDFIVQGQTAKALMALVDAGDNGLTAQEAAGWAYRLSAYCFDLRHKHGLVIDTKREPHPHGWHGRHILRSTVQILEAAHG